MIRIDSITIQIDVNSLIDQLQKTLSRPDPMNEDLTDLDYQHAAQHIIEELKPNRFARFTLAMAEDNRDAFDPNSDLWENDHAGQADLGRWVWHDGQFWVAAPLLSHWVEQTLDEERHRQDLSTAEEHLVYSWARFILNKLNADGPPLRQDSDEIIASMERTFYGTAGQP